MNDRIRAARIEAIRGRERSSDEAAEPNGAWNPAALGAHGASAGFPDGPAAALTAAGHRALRRDGPEGREHPRQTEERDEQQQRDGSRRPARGPARETLAASQDRHRSAMEGFYSALLRSGAGLRPRRLVPVRGAGAAALPLLAAREETNVAVGLRIARGFLARSGG